MPSHIYFSFILVGGISQKLNIMCTCHMVVEWFGPISVMVRKGVHNGADVVLKQEI
jgi:hypothetical protein